jgi:hypothetical protein
MQMKQQAVIEERYKAATLALQKKVHLLCLGRFSLCWHSLVSSTMSLAFSTSGLLQHEEGAAQLETALLVQATPSHTLEQPCTPQYR